MVLYFSLGEARDSESYEEYLSAALPLALGALMGYDSVSPASVKRRRERLTANFEATTTAASNSASRVANGDAQTVTLGVLASTSLEGRVVAGLKSSAALGVRDAGVPGSLDDGVGGVDDTLKVGEASFLGRGGGKGESEEREEVGDLHFVIVFEVFLCLVVDVVLVLVIKDEKPTEMVAAHRLLMHLFCPAWRFLFYHKT